MVKDIKYSGPKANSWNFTVANLVANINFALNSNSNNNNNNSNSDSDSSSGRM